jgi:hypothetical protein
MGLARLELPEEIEIALESTFGGRESALASAVVRLSDAYVEGTPPGRLSDQDRRAYAAYYGPIGALKVGAILEELRARGWTPPQSTLRLADLGAGPGSATLGVALFSGSREIEAALVDRDRGWDVRPLLGTYLDRAAVRVVRSGSDPFAIQGLPFDVIVAAHLLIELDLPLDVLARRLHEQVETALAPGGVWVAIEPATRGATRRLHHLREALIERGVEVLAPCLHQARCPMLARDADWCHEARGWRQPRYHERLDRLTGLDKRALSFAFLAFGRRPLPSVEEVRAARVVSSLLREKGRSRFRSCDAGGRLHEWDLLQRTGGPIAERVDALQRGELVVLPRDGGGRLAAGDALAELTLPGSPRR